ncbi:LacI family DNA-binding transcriptional regulator [Burkholderia gladioli]|uniref:LacI family DNA-binding transcriptional regulator n=1 Tax=Burkholderia gladioli TaxID=28095 RepID=UPI001F14B20B|nr:LacI family DNA-binding transcriptional regulator [Burkholderia gladioli]
MGNASRRAPKPPPTRLEGPPRMADVARLAGVSKMTVSRVLANHRVVAAATRERVLRAVDTLGYVADAAAGALSSGRSDFVAVIVPSLSSSNFSDTVRGLSNALEPRGLQLLIGDTGYDIAREERLIRSFLRYQPRAIALTGAFHTEAATALLKRAGVPIVEMWDLPGAPIDAAVGFSNQRAAREMVVYLHGRGYRRIGFLCGANDNDRRGMERLKGYRAAVRALGLGEPRVVRIGDTPADMTHGGPALDALLARWPDTDAVMSISDMSAFGAIMQCHRRGLRVPEDIAVAGFGDFEVAECSHPTITTVSVDAHGIGQRTGEVLFDAMAHGTALAAGYRHVKLRFSVVPRESA